MCGRYSFAPKPKQHKALESKAQLPAELEISFNIAPTQSAYVITNELPGEFQRMEWGLVPFWSKDGKNTGKLINARAEGIESKPSFREPIKSRRCLVPADSFYEWHKTDAGKEPYRITMKNGEMIYMAGIWEKWRHEGITKRTFSIITTATNREMAVLHDRMPVILPTAKAQQLWLSDLPLSDVLSLLQTPEDGTLSMYRISTKVNKPGNNGEDLHEPVADGATPNTHPKSSPA